MRPELVEHFELQQSFLADSNDPLHQVGERPLCADNGLILGEEHYVRRGDEFLERPSALEPPALLEGRALIPMAGVADRRAGEIKIADIRSRVLRIYRAGGFRKPQAARLDPDVPEAVRSRHHACLANFGESLSEYSSE